MFPQFFYAHQLSITWSPLQLTALNSIFSPTTDGLCAAQKNSSIAFKWRLLQRTIWHYRICMMQCSRILCIATNCTGPPQRRCVGCSLIGPVSIPAGFKRLKSKSVMYGTVWKPADTGPKNENYQKRNPKIRLYCTVQYAGSLCALLCLLSPHPLQSYACNWLHSMAGIWCGLMGD